MRSFTAIAFLLALAFTTFAAPNNNGKGVDNTMNEKDFEKTFHVIPVDEKDREKIKKALTKAEEEINKHNKEDGSSFTESLNAYSILDDKTFKKERTGVVINEAQNRTFATGLIFNEEELYRKYPESEAYLLQLSRESTPPATYDAREHGRISPVKDQGQCGSCTAFASGAAIETCLKDASKSLKDHADISEQYLLDCGMAAHDADGCQGTHNLVTYIRQLADNFGGQTPHENTTPYKQTASSASCDQSAAKYKSGSKVTKWHQFSDVTVDQMKALIYKHGAVISGVKAESGPFKNYNGGIFDVACDDNQIDHAIALVGYGDGYWIGKNSWGTKYWGASEGGFFKIKMGICGIATLAAVPVCEPTGEGAGPAPPPAPPPAPAPSPAPSPSNTDTCDLTNILEQSYIPTPFTGSASLWHFADNFDLHEVSVSCTNSMCTVITATVNGEPKTSGTACEKICGASKC